MAQALDASSTVAHLVLNSQLLRSKLNWIVESQASQNTPRNERNRTLFKCFQA
jgi:hypothetical protein